MQKENPPDGLKAVEESMNTLRSALLKFSEEQAEATLLGRADPLQTPLMNSIMAIQESMNTFLSIATCRKR